MWRALPHCPRGGLGWLPALGHTPFQGVVSSEQPLVVVSTTQVEDCDDSSSFLMEWRLRAPSLASTDLISVESGHHAVLQCNPRASLAALPQTLDRSSSLKLLTASAQSTLSGPSERPGR